MAKRVVAHFAILVDHRIVIPRPLMPPKDITVLESQACEMIRNVSQQSQLPFAKDSRRIPGLGQDARKRC